jgi:hypothetical protein
MTTVLRDERSGSRTALSPLNSLLLLSISLFISVAQVRLINMFLNFKMNADVTHGVFIGKPAWRLFQNRILGPALIESISRVFSVEPTVAYSLFACLTLSIAGCLAYSLGNKLAGNLGGVLSFTALNLGFALLLSNPYLYAWDFIDIIVFFIFVHFIVAEKPYPWFVMLFLVAILNRESALFIAFWLLINPVARGLVSKWLGYPKSRLEWQPMVVGVLCMVAGIALVETLRSALMIEEVGVRQLHMGDHYHSQARLNRWLLINYFTEFSPNMPFVVPIFLVGTIASAVLLGLQWPRHLLGLSMTSLLMIAVLLVIGFLPETRIYLELLPFIVLSVVLLAVPRVDLRWPATGVIAPTPDLGHTAHTRE